MNPFRYRGYVWDEETELYYLRSRYFSITWIRFLNEDNRVKENLYSYASNNPIVKYDPTGNVSVTATGVGMAIGAVVEQGSIATMIGAGSAMFGVVGIFAGVIIIGAAINAAVASKTTAEEIESIVDLTNDLHLGINQAYRSAVNRKFINGYDNHHIVPKNAGLTEYARQVLKDAGMDVATAPENQVILSRQFHQFLHNDFYYIGIDLMMLRVATYAEAHFPGDKEMLRTLVTIALDTTKTYLVVADQAVLKHFL